MKVWELMNKLSELPAGSEVKFKTAIPVKRLKENCITNEFDDEEYYIVTNKVVEVSTDSYETAVLYGEMGKER